MQQKLNVILGYKMGWMLYEMIIQYWGGEGNGKGGKGDSTRLTGWLFRAEGIEWRWREGLQVRREQIASDSSCKNSGLSEGLQVRKEQIGK